MTIFKKFDFVILGAGLAGLACAKRLSENKYTVLLIEKENKVGGLSRSEFFNGFTVDYCAHRFHTKNPDLLKEIKSLSGLKLYRHQKKCRIHMFNKYLKYPFELQNLLRAMPIKNSIVCIISFLKHLFFTKKKSEKEIKTYADWFRNIYGKALYKVMCEPYTTKIWKISPENLSSDWAEQRFYKENMLQVCKRIIIKLLKLDFSSYSLEDEENFPDGGEFYYPPKGIQAIANSFEKFILEHNGNIECTADIKNIDTDKKTAIYTTEEKTIEIEYQYLISTIPLHNLYALTHKKCSEIEISLNKLNYLDIILVYVCINKSKISNDHWLYFSSSNTIFNRATEFVNWSDKMCPKGKTCICFDITCLHTNDLWKKTEQEITDRVLNDAIKVNYLANKNEIISTKIIKLKNAYPIYTLEYKKHLDIVKKYFEKTLDNNIYLLGRTGNFRYNNLDNSIESGFDLALSIHNKI